MIPGIVSGRRRLRRAPAVCFLALAAYALAGSSNHVVTDDLRTWPVIPEWARVGAPDGSIVNLDRTVGPRGSLPTFMGRGPHSPGSTASCSLLTTFALPEEYVASTTDSLTRSTHIYVGAYWEGNTVLRFVIDSLLNQHVDTLPIPYGLVWLINDLDGDGSLELVLERGDGANGFLDIVSTSTWTTRQRFTFPGMNVVMFAQTVQLDGDGLPELYLVPGSLSYTSTLVAIQ